MATKVYRFVLGSPTSPFSGRWRVWTHEDEVHAAVRTETEEVLFTAYPTGRWRISKGSAVSRWTRPREFRPGWTHGPEIVIPYSAAPIRSSTDPFPDEPLTWLPPPAPGHLARFTLLFASSRAEESRWRPTDVPGTQHLVILPLRTMGALHLGRIDLPSGPDNQGAPTVAPSGGAMGLVVIVSADRDGRPSFWESRID